MSPSLRKALGAAGIILFLIIYVIAAVQIGERLHPWPWAALGFYAIAGIAWVFPLRPLFAWMHPKEDAQKPGR
jgi:hypothetical protein